MAHPSRKASRANTDVLVLNSSYEFLQLIELHKAIRLLVKGGAQVVENIEDAYMHTTQMAIPVPSIVKLTKYVNFRARPAPYSKRNVILRDHHTCQYCGFTSTNLTIDHIVPQEKGGKSTWENTVASCLKCNGKKANLSLKDSGLVIRKMPKKPTAYALLKNISKHRNWDRYLFLS